MHLPVLLNQVLNYFEPSSGENYIDATIGGGGHAFPILKRTAPDGRVLGIDNSPEAIESLKLKAEELNLQKRLVLVCDNFSHLKEIVKENNFSSIKGILFDLGLSTDLLEQSNRGFAFMKQEILDMRFNPEKQELTAAMVLNQYPQEELKEIFREYGGERFAQRIAKRIVQERKQEKIIITNQLVNIIKKSLKKYFHIKSLARVFQALRIEVNNELEVLKKGLEQGLDVLEPQGRIAVLSYHSGEDRIVKQFFKTRENVKPLFKKPLVAEAEEVEKNSKARSAKLRVGEKIN